ncbi:hypothetical protein PPYR_00103 [Photinus pyralis]|uniref:C2H2-type domain-containing protein n=1 Tax=Photinus pyralis TaxID=7054 RepID=A0A1Y1KA42_PHOPY|nr:hypothetical protein PPYR_00103 [Photinus pyralis]
MICFSCKKSFDTLYILIRHFKLQHGFKTNSNYTCLEGLCSQSFTNLSSFKRHIHIKHGIATVVDTPDHKRSIPHFEKQTNAVISQALDNESISCSNTESNTSIEDLNEHQNLEQYLTSITKFSANFTLSLHNKNNFAKKDVFFIQEMVTECLLKPIIDLINAILSKKITHYPKYDFDLHELLERLKNPFQFCNTDYKLNMWLYKNNLAGDVLQYTIDNRVIPTFRQGEAVYAEKKVCGIKMPLTFQMKKIFSEHNNLQKTLDCISNIKCSNDNTITSFIQGKLWPEKVKHVSNDAVAIPYFLYADDFEVNNPLGSHCSPITALYYSFPIFFNNSKLENIFLAGLIESAHVKSFGNNECLKTLVDEIIILERDGITINLSGKDIKVYFMLGLVLGDNLGLNSLLDFAKSFSSNYYCRFCKMHKKQCQVACKEDPALMRKPEQYDLNFKSSIENLEYGVQQKSIFNNIPSFHVTTNFAVDIMHDLFEGICHYNLCHIINYYINKLKIFNLEQLNQRKQLINYGRYDVGNISQPINAVHLQNQRLKMSASEMMTFLHYFTFIIGEFVPHQDPVWDFLLDFLQIVDILLAHSISDERIALLRVLIQKNLSSYVSLFKDTLKPKHHFLLHYPMIIKNSGPPRQYWCFRFESKHRELKTYAHVINSRVNLPLSIAKKYELKFAHLFLHSSTTEQVSIIFDKSPSKSNYLDFIYQTLDKDTILCYSEICYKGFVYRTDDFFSSYCGNVVLEQIKEFVSDTNTNKVYIICKELEVNYNAHYDAYMVMGEKDLKIMNINSLSGPPLTCCQLADGKSYVRLKEYFS